MIAADRLFANTRSNARRPRSARWLVACERNESAAAERPTSGTENDEIPTAMSLFSLLHHHTTPWAGRLHRPTQTCCTHPARRLGPCVRTPESADAGCLR